jgi:glycosyltransferase involved in cell wall biosynthesis
LAGEGIECVVCAREVEGLVDSGDICSITRVIRLKEINKLIRCAPPIKEPDTREFDEILGNLSYQLKKIVEKEKIDIIHSHDIRTSLVLERVKEEVGTPFVATGHNTVAPANILSQLYRGEAVYSYLAMLSSFLKREKYDKLICVSNFSYEMYTRFGAPRSKTVVIYNGIDVEEFNPYIDGSTVRSKLGVSAETCLIFTPARIEYRKGFDTIFEALHRLASKGYDFKLLISPRLGSSYHRQAEGELVGLAKRLGLMDYITSATFNQRSMPEAYAASDIVCLMGYENFGYAVAEGMAMGRPVIGAKWSALPELIEHGSNGFLVEPGDPDQLAYYLSLLLRDRVLRERMGSVGRRIALERFNLADNIRRHVELYESLL